MQYPQKYVTHIIFECKIAEANLFAEEAGYYFVLHQALPNCSERTINLTP